MGDLALSQPVPRKKDIVRDRSRNQNGQNGRRCE
jgi:hypothetical protein